ncbi:MAG: UvrD-helicase domain-containing protein [Alistipes sp.]|jgi:ATP-dependent exoDNAse (exonuclease V) beta subunit|nr:UvrD-helicase domain-containing protein [Alistipes sp.]
MGGVKIISASAGSGKTYRLAYEYVKSVVADPSLYRHILAVTFTNKATGEMSSRILLRLHELATPGQASPYMEALLRDLAHTEGLAPITEPKIRARAAEARQNILHDYSRFSVLTIDRFFQRLIRSFIRELGIEVNFNLELETDSLLGLAADALIEDSVADPELRERLFAAARDRVEDNKRWNVREPLMALGAELFGEEYARAHRDAPQKTDTKSDAKPDTTSDAKSDAKPDTKSDAKSLIEAVVERAGEVNDRYKSLAAQMLRTIRRHGLGVNDFRGKSRGLVPWLEKITREKVFIPLSANVRAELEGDALIPELRASLQEMDELHAAGRRLVGSAALLRENHHNFLLLGDLQRRIERICREENIMPISETNRMIARLVGGGDTPFIFEKAGSYFTRFFIDEFQDTSSAQWENFVPLIGNAIASEEGTPVMLIGDIKQAIYRWRGGDWRILSRRVSEEMGADRVERETLDTNHRSARQVVEFNNRAMGLVVEAGNASLDALVAEARAEGAIDNAQSASLTGMLAEAYRDHAQNPRSARDEGYVTFTIYDADEAGQYVPPLVERVEELQSRGFAPGDIAVLVRSNTHGAQVARMLLERKHSNPDSPYCYDVITAEALKVGAAAVSRFVIACLSLAADRDDDISRAVYNGWTGRGFGAPLDDNARLFFARLATLSPEEAFEEIVLRFDLQSRAADVAYIQAVHQQITSFSSRSVADIPLFLKWWREKGADASISMGGEGADRKAITVSTIHKSKGLQYGAVVVPWLSWTTSPGRGVVWAEAGDESLAEAGALPINFKEAMSGSFFAPRYWRETVLAHVDAVNMFYVAATRAQTELHLMTSSSPRLARNAIGNILRGALGVTEAVTEWGAPTHPAAVAEDESRGVVLRDYPTARPTAKVRLRLTSSRYFEEAATDTSATGGADTGEVALTPRDLGIAMHRAFENAAGAADVHRALDRMFAEASVSPAEYGRLRDMVARAFDNPLVAEWFGGEWDEVRNEGDILTPGDVSVKRPDRVMIRGDRAVVVDYKFGRRVLPAHAVQLGGYMSLLREMGYADVTGYLWYVTLGEIEKID